MVGSCGQHIMLQRDNTRRTDLPRGTDYFIASRVNPDTQELEAPFSGQVLRELENS